MIYDAAVIGAGPAGITAALYLVRSGVSTALVEHGAAGGQILSTAEIENYPGFPKGIKGWELADLFEAHLSRYPVDRIRARIARADAGAAGQPAVLHSEDGSALRAKTVIVCTGAQHKELGVPGERELAGRGVSYCAVCDGNFYRGMDVAVVGGGNSALEESLYLSRIVRKVYLIHRRDAFRGDRIYQDKVRETENIELVLNSIVEKIAGGSAVESVAVRDVRTGEHRTIPVNGVFLYVGMKPSSGWLPSSASLDAGGFVETDAEMRTNIPGFFAAGDIRSKRCRQVTSAVGDGAAAATSALSYLEQWHA